MDIGQKIKIARTAKKMTQQELGEIVGVQKSAIAKYETGRVVNIKRHTLKKIANALNIDPTELIFEETPHNIADLHAKVVMDFELMESIDEYYNLTPENQKMIRDLIHSLSKK